jgi:protein-S-isoprenylcysteine O-methyltransferase Ste14
LIERRLQSKEKIREQKLIAKLLKLVAFAAFLLPGLDYRLGWSRTVLGGVPLWLTLLSQTLVLGGLLFVFWVMRVNSFASRTIQVEAAQKVISTGCRPQKRRSGRFLEYQAQAAIISSR